MGVITTFLNESVSMGNFSFSMENLAEAGIIGYVLAFAYDKIKDMLTE